MKNIESTLNWFLDSLRGITRRGKWGCEKRKENMALEKYEKNEKK